MATENTMASNVEAAMRECPVLSVWMRGFHTGFTEPTPTSIEEQEVQNKETKAQTPADKQPYPEKYHQPNPGVYTFEDRKQLVMRLNELIETLMDRENEPDKTRGCICEISDIALSVGADEVVEACEDCRAHDISRMQLAEAVSALIAQLAYEIRKEKLVDAFTMFCKDNNMKPKEMSEILSANLGD